jgi:2-dehydrotetronate isomerase
MPRFAANLSMMFQEHEFLDRFAAASSAGFKGVEFLFPYDFSIADVQDAAKSAGIEIALFNLPPGDWEKAERGLAAMPGREADFAEALDKAICYAVPLGCKRLHMMAGIPGGDADLAQCRATYVSNLKYAAPKLADAGIMGLIEPINTRDIPGYFINYQQDGHDVLANVGADNLMVQMDFYHVQIMEGDIAMRFQKHQAGVGHIQIAGSPGRHEPDIGEINHPYLFEMLDDLGYDGWIGCEYRPAAGTLEGLARWGSDYGLG